MTAFTLNSIYIYFFNKAEKIWQATVFLFAFDTLFISTLIYITGVQQSIFLFMYLVNIILCGFIFQRKGAVFLALFTSACFSILLILGPEVQGQTLYFAVGLNNIAFFAVAYLSGFLSELLNFMDKEIWTQKQDIKALKDLNKIIVENISSGLITISHDFYVMLCNRAALKILGLQVDVTGVLIEHVFPGIRDIILKKKSENRFERKYESPTGEKLVLGFSISPLKTLENDDTGYILIFQDLTEIVRYETAMRRQDKLAAVGKLAAGIAHEIRNPLASISGSVELLKSLVVVKDPDQQKLMDIMIREIDRLNSLITEFLDFVRPQDKNLEICDVDAIIRDTLEILKYNTALPKHVVQSVSLNSRCFVSGDKNKLKQVFLNLFINSYQAMADIPHGNLTIATHQEESGLFVSVKDNGAGMSELTMKRLFEPFFTTKQKGTGLGLATVHKILEIHDAKIFVESHEGAGTEFTIQFKEVIKEGAKQNEGQNTGS